MLDYCIVYLFGKIDVEMLAFFMAISLAPLAEVTALGFTAPIYVAILAIFFLNERIGLKRWTAILSV